MAAPQDLEDVRDPRAHACNIAGSLNELIEHLEADIGRVDDVSAKALFETAREVLQGLKTAFDHFERRSEAAWQEQASPTH
jgi:hypothetical protein